MQIVLLSGGSGSRLWPLSNGVRSKQFLKVLRDSEGEPCSMVQRVFGQIRAAGYDGRITVATSEAQAPSLGMQLDGFDYSIALEPARRDTMPAILLACAHLASERCADEDETVLVAPIDSYVNDDYFTSLADLDECVQDGFASVVLRGVVPTYPSAKYGYIVPSSDCGPAGSRKVERFQEKPTEEEAWGLIREGALWNCGVFAFKLGFALDLLREWALPTGYAELKEHYGELEKTSFDYGVLEKCDSVAVVPYEGTWKDLGTWNTLCDEMADNIAGRVVVDDGCENLHVVNELNTPLVVLGVSDAVVVATPDGILVSDKESSAHSKPYVERIGELRPMHESRRWGHYSVLGHHEYTDGMRTIVKTLHVEAGRHLSYQMHEKRMEVWTVASGHGSVLLDGAETSVGPGDVVKIPRQMKHRLSAAPDSDIVVVEVQLGDELIEEDIIRFDE